MSCRAVRLSLAHRSRWAAVCTLLSLSGCAVLGPNYETPKLSETDVPSRWTSPTESESKAELDRFITAMISIREEIRKIEQGVWPADNNPLKNAPHTQADIIDANWNRPYSREEAVFPLPWVAANKFWPSVNRIDDVYGDRNLFCACAPMSDYN